MRKKRIFGFLMSVLMCIGLFQPMMVQKVSAADGLVLHLKFDGNLDDSSGNTNAGECNYGKIKYENGIFGQCAVFDGKGYIEIADADSLDLKDNYTISLWAYKENMKNEYVPYITKENDANCYKPPYHLYEHWKNTPGIAMYSDDDLYEYFLSGKEIDIRKWFLLTVTYDGKEIRMYENDKLTKRETLEGVPAASVGDLFIGMMDGSVFFKGKMDDLRIYNKRLTAQEVANLYKAGEKSNAVFLKKSNSMVAYYTFDGNFEDSSGYGNDAEKVTAQGSVKFVNAICGKGAMFSKGSYLEVKDNDSINFDEGFSASFWVYINSNDDLMPVLHRLGVSTGYSANEPAYRVRCSNYYLAYNYVPFIYQAGEETSTFYSESIARGKWYHIALTFNGEQIRWYRNGVSVQKDEIDEITMAHASGILMIGSDGDSFFNGTLDELKLYNYALSADEVKKEAKRVDGLSVSAENQKQIKDVRVKKTVSLEVSRKYINTGKTEKLKADVTYKSSNAKIFSVSKSGVITGVKKGTAKLTVTHGGISKVYTVTVN